MLGSTVALACGTAIQTNDGYDAYGVSQTTGTASTNAFQYTEREADAAGLMYYRARYSNPSWGRFASEDPIGLAGGVNSYAYVGQRPLLRKDSSGLSANATSQNLTPAPNHKDRSNPQICLADTFKLDGIVKLGGGLYVCMSIGKYTGELAQDVVDDPSGCEESYIGRKMR